jgi:glutathione S-transferase
MDSNGIESLQPIELYGSNVSYFTGKMENYFSLKGLSYQLKPMQLPRDVRMIEDQVGLWQMPVLKLADGRWMTDSTKTIQWFEAQNSANPIIPSDPLQAFICYLIEDYADEWLWRPAMHFSWHYAEGAHFASRHLADEVLGSVKVPGALKRWQLRRRQRSGYTTGDGITPACVEGVEKIYFDTLNHLQRIFENRLFLLGDRPSLADIGLSGPFFRHFALDPVPLENMRQLAPAVLEWVARLWNTRMSEHTADWSEGIPEDLTPLLKDIGSSYLPYLCANSKAVANGQKLFDAEINGVPYRKARYSHYRVWCLQQLRDRFNELEGEASEQAKVLLETTGCWEPLWREQTLPLLPDQEAGLPFKASTKMIGTNE